MVRIGGPSSKAESEAARTEVARSEGSAEPAPLPPEDQLETNARETGPRVLPALNAEVNPSTTSPEITHNLLRERLSYSRRAQRSAPEEAIADLTPIDPTAARS